jgi:hypothetical protein
MRPMITTLLDPQRPPRCDRVYDHHRFRLRMLELIMTAQLRFFLLVRDVDLRESRCLTIRWIR